MKVKMVRTLTLIFVTLFIREIHSYGLSGISNVINNSKKLICEEIKLQSCAILKMQPLNKLATEGINRLAQCHGYNKNESPKAGLNQSDPVKVEISGELVKVQELNTNLKVTFAQRIETQIILL